MLDSVTEVVQLVLCVEEVLYHMMTWGPSSACRWRCNFSTFTPRLHHWLCPPHIQKQASSSSLNSLAHYPVVVDSVENV